MSNAIISNADGLVPWTTRASQIQIVRWSILVGSSEGVGDGISMSVLRDFHADAYFNAERSETGKEKGRKS